MILYLGAEILTIIIMTAFLLTDRHLRRRDTAESKRIFLIAVLTMAGALVNVGNTMYYEYCSVEETDKWFMLFAFIFVTLCCLKEMISLQIALQWNLFVDYGIYRSYDHVLKKRRRTIIPVIAIASIFVILYYFFDSLMKMAGIAVLIMIGFTLLCILLQLYLCVNAINIVRSVKKRRVPPSFLRLSVFLIPFVLGYALDFVPVINEVDFRSICTAIAVILTWQSVKNHYRYVDPYTGFFNREFLKSMNEYMEKSGYPNGIGIYFKAPESNGKLIPVLDGLKPEDSEIFSLGKDEYLLMAGPQKESVIRFLIKSVRLKAAEDLKDIELTDAYAIRDSNESADAFTGRLLKLAE